MAGGVSFRMESFLSIVHHLDSVITFVSAITEILSSLPFRPSLSLRHHSHFGHHLCSVITPISAITLCYGLSVRTILRMHHRQEPNPRMLHHRQEPNHCCELSIFKYGGDDSYRDDVRPFCNPGEVNPRFLSSRAMVILKKMSGYCLHQIQKEGFFLPGQVQKEGFFLPSR